MRARAIVEGRTSWHSLSAIKLAESELNEACRQDDALRHSRRIPKAHEERWLKVWDEEIVPTRILCDHRGQVDAELRLAPKGASAVDLLVRVSELTEAIEVTLAYPARHGDWNCDGRTSPGAQEALRAEMLNRDGWVSATDPITRDRRTGRAEYEDELAARAIEDAIPEWANGIAFALNKKQREASYGQGSILAVYGYGLSGDFEPSRRTVSLDSILAQVPLPTLANGFDRTFVFGWHEGWCRELGV